MLRIIAPTTQKAKQLGLLILDHPPQNWGMLFFATRAIHTIGMKFPIDVVSLDHNLKVINIDTVYPGVDNYSIPGTTHVLELPSRSTARHKLVPGSRLALKF